MKNGANDADVNFLNAIGIFIGRIRVAFRGLWKNPLINISAIISIALGIGVFIAMFTIYDEFLLRRLPVPEPEKLVNFSAPGPKPGSQTSNRAAGIAYFQTLGIPLLAGRDFTREDVSGRQKVAVVNEAFAEKYNLGRDAVGKRISIGGNVLDVEIIGLARNAKVCTLGGADTAIRRKDKKDVKFISAHLLSPD
jgi:ABC-type antimicrobial peptide transport system permease subunit